MLICSFFLLQTVLHREAHQAGVQQSRDGSTLRIRFAAHLSEFLRRFESDDAQVGDSPRLGADVGRKIQSHAESLVGVEEQSLRIGRHFRQQTGQRLYGAGGETL